MKKSSLLQGFASVGPVSTIVQAHFFLGEPFFAEQVIGTILVIVGVLLVGWKSKKDPAPPGPINDLKTQ